MAEPVSIRLSRDQTRLLMQTTDKTHISLPFNALGMEVLRRVMVERSAIAHAVISTKAAPTQYQVEELLKALASNSSVTVTRVGLKKAPDNLSLEDLGL